MYSWTSAGNGRKTSKPAKKAVAILRRGTGRSAAITAAKTYVRVTSGEPTARLTISLARPSRAGSSPLKIPIGTPIASAGQKCLR
jgi:hypothetical protein